jgi:hypothetical protein
MSFFQGTPIRMAVFEAECNAALPLALPFLFFEVECNETFFCERSEFL